MGADLTPMPDVYDEGYFERAEGSNYTNYGDDGGWLVTCIRLKQILPEGARILEVGCAKGYFVGWAERLGFDAYGVDLSEYAISKSVMPHKTQQADAASLPFEENEFDAVVSWEFLEHIPEEWIPEVLSEMHRVTKPDGTWVHRICLPGDEHDNDHTHVTVKPREWWDDVFEQWFRHSDPEREELLNSAFQGRDWAGRFFVLP